MALRTFEKYKNREKEIEEKNTEFTSNKTDLSLKGQTIQLSINVSDRVWAKLTHSCPLASATIPHQAD